MLIRLCAGDPAAGCTLQESLADEVGLNHVFNGRLLFAGRGRDGVEANWAAAKFLDDGAEDSAVRCVKAERIDLKEGKGARDYVFGQIAPLKLGHVAAALQEVVCSTRRGAAALSDISEDSLACRNAKEGRRAGENLRELLVAVELEAKRTAREAGTQGG